MKDTVGVVYIIHADVPLHHARHYVGWTEDLITRINTHKNGCGSPLLRAMTKAGILWEVVDSFPGTPEDEKRIKRRKQTSFYCSRCKS